MSTTPGHGPCCGGEQQGRNELRSHREVRRRRRSGADGEPGRLSLLHPGNAASEIDEREDRGYEQRFHESESGPTKMSEDLRKEGLGRPLLVRPVKVRRRVRKRIGPE